MKAFLPRLLPAILVLVGFSAEAYGASHSYLNYNRSSTRNHVFVHQGVEGEFGNYSTKGTLIGEDGESESYTDDQAWKGYGISTELGLEVMKFVQFKGGHTFINMQHQDDRFENLRGSRLNAAISLVFLAPVFNLEVGAGVTGSRLDYQRKLESATFNGSGMYQELGVNYFFSSKLSFNFTARLMQEHLARTGGSSAVKDMDTETTNMGLGFRIWL